MLPFLANEWFVFCCCFFKRNRTYQVDVQEGSSLMGQREVKGLARETKRVHGKELLQNKATSEHTLCTGNCEDVTGGRRVGKYFVSTIVCRK